MSNSPNHIYQLKLSEPEALAQAVIWVNHVKGCNFCLQHLLGLNRADAVAQYFKTDAMGLEDHATLQYMSATIRPGDELYDTLVEVLIWYYLITKSKLG